MSTRAYSRTVPDGATTDSADIDIEMQAKGRDLDEALVQGGHKMPVLTHAAGFEEGNGKHCVGIEDQVDHDDHGYFTIWWNFAGTTYGARAYGKDHASKAGWIEANPDIGGGLPAQWVGKNVTTGDDPGHRHSRQVLIGPIPQGASSPSAPLYHTYIRRHAGAGKITRIDIRTVVAAPFDTTLEIRKTVGAPANGVDVRADGVASVVVATVTVLTGQFAASSGAIAVNIADGEVLAVKQTVGRFGNNDVVHVHVTIVV